MINIEETTELQAPEFVFVADRRRQNTEAYFKELEKIRKKNNADYRLDDLANIFSFFAGMGMTGLMFTAVLRLAGVI